MKLKELDVSMINNYLDRVLMHQDMGYFPIDENAPDEDKVVQFNYLLMILNEMLDLGLPYITKWDLGEINWVLNEIETETGISL